MKLLHPSAIALPCLLAALLVAACGPEAESSAAKALHPDTGEVSSEARACAHSSCTLGVKLVADCDPCVKKICAKDSFCCKSTWDQRCVDAVPSICGLSCSGGGSGGGTGGGSGGGTGGGSGGGTGGGSGGGTGGGSGGGTGGGSGGGTGGGSGGGGGKLTLTIYPRVGSATDSAATPMGPGLVLGGGGTDVDSAFVWIHDTIAGSTSTTANGGDLVVLRATGTNAYDPYIAKLAHFNSVQTLLLPTPPTAADFDAAAAIVAKAETVFFAGGNQADYVGWKGSTLMAAVAQVYARGGVVGGTSAGCSILGQFAYDAVTSDPNSNTTTADAVTNPYRSTISFTRDLFSFPALADAITDPHFVTRDRLGRLASFMARQIADGAVTSTPPQVLGIGVDEASALLVDAHGIGKLALQYSNGGAAYLLVGGAADQISAGKPLLYRNLRVSRLNRVGQTYDFNKRCGNGTTYSITVDGSLATPYLPSNPYSPAGTAEVCP